MNLLVGLGLLLALHAAPTGAPTPEEERLFAEGLRAFDAGDGRAAETAWKQGYSLRRDPAFLVRIGEAQEKAGAPQEAAESYRRYLREAPAAADRAEIEQRLIRLTPGLPAGPGASGKTTNQDQTGTPSPKPSPSPSPSPTPALPENQSPATQPPGVIPAPAIPPAVDPEFQRRPVRGQEAPSGWNVYNATAWISLAATVVLLGTAGFYGASAASKKDDVNRLITYRDPDTGAPIEYQSVAAQYQSAVDEGRHDDHGAKVFLLTAAGTAAVATTFFIINGLRESPAGVAMAPDERGRNLAVVGSWRWRF
jgi:hypothetical protein